MADRRQRSQSSADRNRQRRNRPETADRERYYSDGRRRRTDDRYDTYEAERRRGRKKGGQPSSGKQTRRKKKKGASVGAKIAIGVCIVLLILVLAAIGVLASKMGKLEQVKLDPTKLNIPDNLSYDETGYLNVALFGVDTRENNDEMGTRSDTIIIASLNRETKELKLASIYRDTLLQQDDGTFNKANSAYSYGGAEEAISMLNRNLGMDIQHYVTVDFSAMVNVIDALGGIDIEVTEEELPYVNGYAAEITENTGIDTWALEEPGLHHLNGVLATAYARIRYTTGDDYKRAERQRTVLARIAEKAQQADLVTLNTIIDEVFPKVETNFTLMEILAYAKDVKKYKMGETTGFPFEKDTMDYMTAGNVVVPIDLLGNVKQLHKYFFGTEEETGLDKVKSISEKIIYQTGMRPEDYGYGDSSYADYDYASEGQFEDTGGGDYGTGYDNSYDSSGGYYDSYEEDGSYSYGTDAYNNDTSYGSEYYEDTGDYGNTGYDENYEY